MIAPDIELRGIRRRFGATIANDAIDIRFLSGSIHALVGENGAGKSTLMRILYGLLRPDAGEVRIAGHAVALDSPARAREHGIGMIHQHFMLIPPLTVLDNIILGIPGERGLGRLHRARLAERFREVSRAYGFDLDPFARVDSLGVGDRQRVEIARLLFNDARVLICDEPTAVLAPPEVETLFRVLQRLREEGRTIILITHKLAEVLELADRVTVLRRGRVTGEAERGTFDSAQLVRWIVGESAPVEAVEPAACVRGPAQPDRDVVLEARGVTVRLTGSRVALDAIDLALHRGEIVGIAGVQGNGQRELAEVLSGRRGFDGGALTIAGRAFAPGDTVPADARPALIPEDRTTEGFFARMTLWENLLLGHLRETALIRHGLYSRARVREWARPVLEQYRVDPPRPDLLAEFLSGGNQQKLICARELARRRPILVAAQPTRGIDIAATRFLHDLLRVYCKEGGALLLISADLDEIRALSDRIAVLYRGRLGPARPCAEIGVQALGREMVGMR